MRKTNSLQAVTAVLAGALAFTAATATAEAKVGEEKAGPLMGNFKLAPAVTFGDGGYLNLTQFAMELEIAYAVDHDNNAYLGFNPQFQFGGYGGAFINLTGTFQYDIAIKSVTGLYLYPKINLGLAIFTNSYGGYCTARRCYGGGGSDVAFALQPEFGVKYNIFKNFHVLGEPLSFPIYIGGYTFAQWRFWLGCGFDLDP
jgi:hypothetical protein